LVPKKIDGRSFVSEI
jgi:hypothetical protein